HVAMDPTSGSDRVLGGAQDNGSVITGLDWGVTDVDQTAAFTLPRGGDGAAVAFGALPSNEFIFFFASQGGTLNRFDSATASYDFGSAPFFTLAPSGSSSQFVTYYYLDQDNPNAIYYAGLSILYLSDDAQNVNRNTWTNVGALPISQNLRTFATTPGAYNPSTSNLFIGGQNGGLFRVPDPQNIVSLNVAAENITPSGASTDSGSIVSGIAIHPTNPDIMLVVYANYGIDNIFITSNATDANPTWTLVERNLSSHSIRSAAITEVDGNITYFVGTARGLYSSADPSTIDWSLEGVDEIGLAVVSQLVYRHADAKLLVGTHGNGMFETTVGAALSIDEFANADVDIKIYPNPTIDKLTLLAKNSINVSAVPFEIYNLTGSLVKTGVTSFEGELSTADLSAGMYLLRLEAEDNPMSLKFVKK
ncbi:MAG: T9SS type A sorting domain-containing protein, partial [Bacteroidota bacterium]